jgi:hypothetical protein
MWKGLWDSLGKVLFPEYKKLEDNYYDVCRKLSSLKYSIEIEKENAEKYKNAIKNITEKSDVIYHKYINTNPKTLLVRTNRDKEQLVIYNLDSKLEEIGSLSFTFCEIDLKIDLIRIIDPALRGKGGLGSALLREAENLFPYASVYGTVVPQDEHTSRENLIKFYVLNGYEIKETENHPTFYKKRSCLKSDK